LFKTNLLTVATGNPEKQFIIYNRGKPLLAIACGCVGGGDAASLFS